METRTIVWTPRRDEETTADALAAALDAEVRRHSSRGAKLVSVNQEGTDYLLTFEVLRRRR